LRQEIKAADQEIGNLRSELEQKETQLAALVAENEERAALALHIEQGDLL
jgi:hypothetical protein